MHAWRIALTGALVVAASAAMAQDRTQGRSMVISQYGIVAAEHPIAARAGTAMLESGGNAIDAAVAANAAMGLVAPMMNGIGGDLFAIVYDAKTKQVYGLNASGWAPKALTPEYLVLNGARRMPAMPVRGTDRYGHFDLYEPPVEELGARELAVHDHVYNCYAENYREQVRRHEEDFAET